MPRSNGEGTQEFRYVVLPNVSLQNRTARITIAGQSHRIEQRGLEEAKVSGDVSEVTGSCPALRFTVRGTVVTTSSTTEFRKGPCHDVTPGREVAVEGARQVDGSIAADKVELKK
jgi:hypothetical protein